MTNEPVCESCGVPMHKHLGLYGTCNRLQAAISGINLLKMCSEKNKAKIINQILKEIS